MCDEECKLDKSTSTSSTANCFYPEQVTSYSVSNFKLREYGTITGTLISSDATEAEKLFDGDNLNGWDASSGTCHVG